MTFDCQAQDNIDLDYWDVMPKSITVNCTLEDVTFPLMIYGVPRDAVAYRVINQAIASVSADGEVTLGTVRGTTMILAWRKDDPCDVKYIQVSVVCPCDEYLPGGTRGGQAGMSPPSSPAPQGSPEECDGAESLTMIVSGFAGACAGLNGTHVLVRSGSHVWVDAAGGMQVRRSTDRWRVEAGVGTPVFAEDYPAPLTCAGDHPTGSGNLVSAGCGQTGHYTIA